jgi:hypothetical protein
LVERLDRLKFVNSGSGPDASEHDDYTVGLGLAESTAPEAEMESHRRRKTCERWRGEERTP